MNKSSLLPLSEVAIRLDPRDRIAIAKVDLPAGTILMLDDQAETKVKLLKTVPSGHKVALQPIAAGEAVLRYGHKIGIATQPVQPGEWIHSHNLDVGDMQRQFSIQVVENPPAAEPVEAAKRTFLGYPRPNGQFGTRNYIFVISTVNCSATAAQAISAYFTPERLAAYPNVDGVAAIVHDSGCATPINSIPYRYLARLLTNVALNPNCAGAIYVSLGCEVMQMREAIQWVGQENPAALRLLDDLQLLTIQDVGGIEKTVVAGVEAIQAMLPQANRVQRVPAPLSTLSLGLECGGSDGWSGVTANPLVGLVSDRLVACGGTAVLSETPEIYGAEHLLTCRCANQQAGERLVKCIHGWQRMAEMLEFSLDNNPTPGNKAGGLTTIYEKSLGAVAKGGRTPLVATYEYAEKITEHGFVFMDTPGYDPASISGMVAGGCNMVIFTTGRGSVFGGTVAPCIKVATNSATYERIVSDMDYNAGRILEGLPLEQAADELFDMVIESASGKRTKSEASGFREIEFVPWLSGYML